jgi:hypothetical protein
MTKQQTTERQRWCGLRLDIMAAIISKKIAGREGDVGAFVRRFEAQRSVNIQ